MSPEVSKAHRREQRMIHRDHCPTEQGRLMGARKQTRANTRRARTVETSGAKRYQVPRACLRCKSLRRGCENSRPCQRCVRAGVGNECVASAVPAWAAASPFASGVPSPALWTQVADVATSATVDECAAAFFESCYPTIPILLPEYVTQLQERVAVDATSAVEECVLLVALCAYVLLHVQDPSGDASTQESPEDRVRRGIDLLDTATAAQRNLLGGASPSLLSCLLSFFLYAGQNRLSRHSQIFLLIRQAATLWTLVNDRPQSVSQDEGLISRRLFWIILVSERSHAIRYGRSITLHITPDSPSLDEHKQAFPGLWSLSALFKPVDSAFMAIMNRETISTTHSAQVLDVAERDVNSAILSSSSLRHMQKANLRVTQLWLRNVLWQLRLRLGLLTATSHQRSLTYHYPLDIARELTLSTRDLPTHSIAVHGVGLTEKLFDIASTVVDIIAGVPQIENRQGAAEEEERSNDDLVYLRGLITQLPGGDDVYDRLLDKHVEQALHSPLMQGHTT